MKKLINLSLVLSAIVLLSMSAVRPANKHFTGKKTVYSFYVANGTAWRGYITTYGALYLPYNDTFGTSGYYYMGAVNTAQADYITVNVTSFASGSHLYQLTGVTGASPITTSTGHASWTGLTVTGNVTCSIY